MAEFINKKTAPIYSTVDQHLLNSCQEINAAVTVIPGLYFKSYSRYAESRIPFEIFGLISMTEESGYYCNVVDFNIKYVNEKFSKGQIIFPALQFDEDFYLNSSISLINTKARIFLFLVSIHTNGNMFHSLKIAQSLKSRNPECLIVFAGLGPSSRADDVLEVYPEVDVIIDGEAEATFADLLAKLHYWIVDSKSKRISLFKLLADIPGISFNTERGKIKKNGNRPLINDLNDLPFPSFEYYGGVMKFLSEYTKDIPFLSVEEHIHLEFGRGCPFDCTFCSNGYLWKRKYRLKSPDRMISEISYCHQKFGAKKFLFHQQLFTAHENKTLEFCEALIANNLNIEWSCFTRSDRLTDKLLAAMKKSGCNTVMIGIESGSQRIQDLIGKNTVLSEVESAIEKIISYGIKPQLSFIIGFPDETQEDFQLTLDMYFKYKYLDNVESQIGILAPAGGIRILDQYNDELLFDGIQTTTWYTRFFDKESIHEMQENPRVYPQNFYFKTPHISREIVKFVKTFDIVASYLTQTIKFIVINYPVTIPYDLHKRYKVWRDNTHQSNLKAKNYYGNIMWDSDISSIIIDFAQFIEEAIIPLCPNYDFLYDLAKYELTLALLNERIREDYYQETCTSAPSKGRLTDNPINDPYMKIEIKAKYDIYKIFYRIKNNYDVNDIYQYKKNNTYSLSFIDRTKILLNNHDELGREKEILSLSRQIEF